MMLLRPSVGRTTVDPSNAAASGFSDVASGAYYSKAINWATANGIAYGKGNNLFDPDGTVTRAEAVTFLQRWLGGASGTSSLTVLRCGIQLLLLRSCRLGCEERRDERYECYDIRAEHEVQQRTGRYVYLQSGVLKRFMLEE